MSVYHLRGVLNSNNIGGTEVETVEETEDQDGMILIGLNNLTADASDLAVLNMPHPASERNSGQVNFSQWKKIK